MANYSYEVFDDLEKSKGGGRQFEECSSHSAIGDLGKKMVM